MIHLIAAIAENGVIGRNGTLPWEITADLQHFKKLTMGCTVIMGRHTYESIGRPLSGRQNIILSHTLQRLDGCEIVRSLEEALDLAALEHIFIIGGAQLYAEGLSVAQQLNITWVHAVPEGDTFFPSVAWDQYIEIGREFHEGFPDFTFVTYQHKSVF